MNEMEKPKKNPIRSSAKFFLILGIILVFAALILIIYNKIDADRAYSASEKIIKQMDEKEKEIKEEVYDYLGESGTYSEEKEQTLPEKDDSEMLTVSVDGHEYIGRLEIVHLGITLPVMSEWSYPNLRIAPCRYAGTAGGRNLIIAGHNYEKHFGLLRQLTPGSKIKFTDITGKIYTYDVTIIDTIGGTDVEAMEAGDWDLTLFTCTVGGKSRVTVRCSLEDVSQPEESQPDEIQEFE